MTRKTAAVILGFTFLAVGLLGFFPNPIIANSPEAIFHADAVHSTVHIVSGILFLVFAYAATARVGVFLKVFGIVYFLLGVLGLFSIGSSGMTTLIGFLHVNGADNYLHIALGIIAFLAGLLNETVD